MEGRMRITLTMEDLRAGRRLPSVRELARQYPELTYVHTISRDIVAREETAIMLALEAGYRKADCLGPFDIHPLAVSAVMCDLHEVAEYQSIHDYRWDYTINSDDDLEITFVFGNTPHAVLFKMATSLL
jgi:hypothetical protein